MLLEECEVRATAGIPGCDNEYIGSYFPGLPGGEGVEVRDCDSVVVARSTVVGGPGGQGGLCLSNWPTAGATWPWKRVLVG